MNHDRIMTPSNSDTRTGGVAGPATLRGIAPGFGMDSRFNVTVIATTPEGTIAALKTAARLARNLDAPITLAMIEVLRPHLPLERSPFIIDFLEKRAFALVSDAGIREQPVTVQIWFCHDRKKCLRQALGSRSLAVIGGTKHWWRRAEGKLEEWLCREGYPTIFADAEAKSFTEMIPKSNRQAIVHCVVKNPDRKIMPPEAK
jgi:hypothetical protein